MKHCKPFKVFAYYDKEDYKIVLPLQIMLGKNKQEIYDNIIFDLENKWVSKLKDIVFNIQELQMINFEDLIIPLSKPLPVSNVKPIIPTLQKHDFTNGINPNIIKSIN